MIRLRPFLASALILLLIATGLGIGMTRGAMAADAQLCSVTGPGPVVLAHDGLPLFDSDGAPVTLDRDACLDCLVVVFDLPPAAPGAWMPMGPGVALGASEGSGKIATRSMAGGQARAPPRAA